MHWSGMKILWDIWSDHGLDLLISIFNLILSLVSPLLNDSLRNGHCVPILPNKTWEKVSWGHLGNEFPLLKREMRQRKCHPLNIVMSGYNDWNCCCRFTVMSGGSWGQWLHRDGWADRCESLGSGRSEPTWRFLLLDHISWEIIGLWIFETN